MWKLTFLVALLAFRSSLPGQTPNLIPRVVFPEEAVGAPFWLLAPQIVVVRIVDTKLTERAIQLAPHGIRVRLVAVDAEVENTIQGTLARGPMRFYFFVNEPSPDGYTTYIYWPAPGGRYVVFLRQDGGIMRTMADVAPPEIRLFSGVHKDLGEFLNQSNKRDPGKAILHAALVPSEGSEKGFAASIQHTEASIRQFVNPSDLALALRSLLAHPESEVRTQACLTLATEYLYRDPCLLALLDASDAKVKGRVELLMRGRRESTSDLVRQLRDAPLSVSSSARIDDLEGDLELFTFDWAPEVRQQACRTLQQLFVGIVFPSCQN
jgi:hypothetical protein